MCKLLDARKEEYLRQKKEKQRSKAGKAQAIKELAIRVRQTSLATPGQAPWHGDSALLAVCQPHVRRSMMTHTTHRLPPPPQTI